MRKLIQGLKQNYSGTEWAMYTTGHSLGASVAQAMHIKFADDVQYSCLFENPGVPRYWRDQAGEKGVQHWKQHSTGQFSRLPSLLGCSGAGCSRALHCHSIGQFRGCTTVRSDSQVSNGAARSGFMSSPFCASAEGRGGQTQRQCHERLSAGARPA